MGSRGPIRLVVRQHDPLDAIDELVVSHGEAVRGEDVLKMMAVSLEPPGDSQGPG